MAQSGGIHGESKIEQGGAITGSSCPAYTLESPTISSLPILIAVPHAGREYPSDVIAAMRDPGFASLRLEDRFVDVLAREVAKQCGAALLVAHAPRAMLDLNRAQDDVDWSMIKGRAALLPRHSHANRRARSGLGLVPRRLPGTGEIWKSPLPRAELDARIAGIHRPYHAAISQSLERIRDEWGAALLVDLHSMPPLRSRGPEQPAAEIVVGDRFGASCDSTISLAALKSIERSGRPVAHNRPYSGGFVLDRHALPRRGLHAIQLEICRATYLDAALVEPSRGLLPLAKYLATLVRELGEATARLASGNHFAQAAE